MGVKISLILTLFFIFFLLGNGLGAHIAFFTPLGTYSHRVSMWPIVQKLVQNGHDLTFISAYEPKSPLPNVTELIPKDMAKYVNDYTQGGDLDVTNRLSGELEACYDHGPNMGINVCRRFLDDPMVKEWFKSEPQIDLFVVDYFFSECIFGLVHKLKAPFIYYAPTNIIGLLYETFGILPDSAGIPDFDMNYTPPMTFWQRAVNMMQPIIWRWKVQGYYEELGKMLKEKMGGLQDLPPIEEMVRNASMLFWSESVVEGYPFQLPPNWVQVPGMHCTDDTNPLPKEQEEVIRKGKDGFIYISFGSAVVPGNLPRGHRLAFFEAVRSFPNIQFLWKWTGEMPPKEEIPPNLYLGTWFSQQDVLAHKRILAFVTHAGRQSVQESIFHRVPVIAVPVYEDQDYTARRITQNGGGVMLEIATIKKEEVEEAIREITTKPKYKERMKRLSDIFRDRPIHSADLALYNIEYIIRHKGDLSHFRSPSFHLTWYERRHVDVWAAIIITILFVTSIPIYIIICVFQKICCKNGEDVKQKKIKSNKRKDD